MTVWNSTLVEQLMETSGAGGMDAIGTISTPNITTIQFTSNNTSSTEVSFWEKLLMMSDDESVLAERVLQPMKYVFTALALPLALANIIVFTQKDMRSASAVYVIGLNVGQIIYVGTTTINDVWIESLGGPAKNRYQCFFHYYIAMYVALMIAKRGSYVILCLASIERLYAVLRPLHIKNFVLAKRPLLCVLIAYTISALWHAYAPARSTFVMVKIAPNENPVCFFHRTKLYLSNPTLNDGFSLSAKIVLSYASLLLQVVMNVLTVWALRRHNMANKHVTSSAKEDAKRQQERQLTVTLLGASVSFVSLSLPTMCLNLLSIIYPVFPYNYGNLHTVVMKTSYNLAVLASGVDFFCYFGLSSKFRHTLRKLIGCKVVPSSDTAKRKPNTVTVDVSSDNTGNN